MRCPLSRRNPPGGWGLRAISASLVVADVPASPPPRSWIWPHKPHPQLAIYFLDRTLDLIRNSLHAWSLLSRRQEAAPVCLLTSQRPQSLEPGAEIPASRIVR